MVPGISQLNSLSRKVHGAFLACGVDHFSFDSGYFRALKQ